LDGYNTSDLWSYDGSLTTPPCTEGIKWTVFKQVGNLTTAQLNKFKTSIAEPGTGNYRVVQPLDGRILVYYAGAFEMMVSAVVPLAAMFSLF